MCYFGNDLTVLENSTSSCSFDQNALQSLTLQYKPDTWLHELVEQIFVLLQELYTGGNDRQILVWSPSKWNTNELVHPLNFETVFFISATPIPASLVLSSQHYLVFQDEWLKMGKASALDQDNWSD